MCESHILALSGRGERAHATCRAHLLADPCAAKLVGKEGPPCSSLHIGSRLLGGQGISLRVAFCRGSERTNERTELSRKMYFSYLLLNRRARAIDTLDQKRNGVGVGGEEGRKEGRKEGEGGRLAEWQTGRMASKRGDRPTDRPTERRVRSDGRQARAYVQRADI